MAYAGHARVILKEVDLSTRIPGFAGVFGGIVFNAKKGPLEPYLVTNETDFLKIFTPEETVKVGYSNGYFSALAFLQKSQNLWVRRAIGDNYKSAGVSVNKFQDSSTNTSWSDGEADPTAHIAGDSEVFSLYASNPGEWINDFCVKIGLARQAEDIVLSSSTVINTEATNATATLGYTHVTPAVSAVAETEGFVVTAVPGAEANGITIKLENTTEENSIVLNDNILETKVTSTTTYAELCTLFETVTGTVLSAETSSPEATVGDIGEAIEVQFEGGADEQTDFTTDEINISFVSGNQFNGKTFEIIDGAEPGEETLTVSTSAISLMIADGATTEGVIKDVLESHQDVFQSVIVQNPTQPFVLASAEATADITGGTNAASTITSSARWASGEPVRFTISGMGTLPAGLVQNTTYYTIADSETSFKVASSLTNALAGIAMVFTSTGSGTMKMVPLAEHTEPDSIKIEVFNKGNLNVALETWYVSRDQNALNGYGQNMYIENVLEGSSYIRAMDNPLVLGDPTPQTTPLYFNGGDDGEPVTDGNMMQAADDFLTIDRYNVTVLMDGGWATPAYQRELDYIAESRGDCVAYLSTPYDKEASANYLNDLIDYRKFVLNLGSSRSALFSPHLKVYDKYNSRELYVSPDGYAAAALAYSAMNTEMWYPPAGFSRGMVNALDCRRRFQSAELTVLYDADINPLRFFPGRGIAVWGQKTLLGRPTALDRLNVRLLLCVIEPAIVTYLEDFLFELNDDETRSRAKSGIDSYMDGIKGRRGVYDYQCICSDENNKPEDIDSYQMNVDLYIQPTKAVEYIPTRIIITRTGVSFSA